MNNFELYRHFDSNDVLMYVGQSFSAVARLSQHKTTAHWFKDIARVEIERFPSQGKLDEAEIEAIKKETPKCNVKHNNKTPARYAFDCTDGTSFEVPKPFTAEGFFDAAGDAFADRVWSCIDGAEVDIEDGETDHETILRAVMNCWTCAVLGAFQEYGVAGAPMIKFERFVQIGVLCWNYKADYDVTLEYRKRGKEYRVLVDSRHVIAGLGITA